MIKGCVNIEYQYGTYSIEAGYLVCTSSSWKPMVPRGLKVDYSRSSEFFIIREGSLDSNNLAKWYFQVPLC